MAMAEAAEGEVGMAVAAVVVVRRVAEMEEVVAWLGRSQGVQVGTTEGAC